MPDIQKLKETLRAYTGDAASLEQFTTVATEVLGSDWAQRIYDALSDLTPEEQEKLNHAFQYYAGVTAWNEIQGYLTQTTPLDTSLIAERIPVLSHWLAFFGEAGEAAVTQLREKAALPITSTDTPEATGTTETPAETISQTTTNSQSETPTDEIMQSEQQEVVTEPSPKVETEVEQPKPEPIWAVEKVFRQMELTQNVQAWITARCIELGNIEIFAYPHYGFLVDLMRQTKRDIQELLADTDQLGAIAASYEDGVKRLQNMQISLERDLEIAEQNGTSEETDLLRDDLSRQDIQKTLGQLDTSGTPEYLGPAPDGFEPLMDPYAELDEKPIKEEYRKIENVVLSETRQSIPQNVIKEKEEKTSSQTPQNGVKRKLSFSLGNKIKPSAG